MLNSISFILFEALIISGCFSLISNKLEEEEKDAVFTALIVFNYAFFLGGS